MIKKVILIGAGFFLASLVAFQPQLLAANTFLKEFLNHEALALLAVIFTISMASVANIELSVSRLKKVEYKQKNEILQALDALRVEIKDNVALLFWFLIAAVLILIGFGWIPSECLHLISIVYAALLWILLLFILITYDIYQVIIGLSKLDV